VRVAGLLSTDPKEFVTVTVKLAPLSVVVAGGVV
jgi:hypothetical protein